MYVERFYRQWVESAELCRFQLTVRESDLLVLCDRNLRAEGYAALLRVRKQLERQLKRQPGFGTSLSPVDVKDDAPAVVRAMAASGHTWRVGPMAAVAGAVAEYVGRRLAQEAGTVIVENGGDVFVKSPKPVRFALYAGEESPFSNKLAFQVEAENGLGVCTSSGKVGPSLSMGCADAVVAISRSGAGADAAATAIANGIQSPCDVDEVVESARQSQGIDGLIVCAGDRLGVWGDLELIKL